MNTSALLTMLITEAVITLVTIYFFWKVLKTPPKPEEDSYSEE
jgi:hypothetical protein